MRSGAKDVRSIVQTAIARHGASQEALIPILSDVNRDVGYLSRDALEEISSELHIVKSQLMSVAGFYRMLSTDPMGKHVIKFCENAPCHVVGGREVWEALKEELGLQPGEISADGKWSLITTSCLGVCSVGPVMLIDDDIYGNLNPARVPEILARYT